MQQSTGTLNVQSFGLLKQFNSVELTREKIERVIGKVGKEIVFDYRRFQWMAASLTWRIEIGNFEYIDNVLIGLRKAMEEYFTDWGIKMDVTYTESEGV